MKPRAQLNLDQLELNLALGWSEAERAQKQIILVDIMINFAEPPKACITDQLEDTYCYDTLIKQLVETIAPKSFKLIEHLAREIYLLIKKFFTQPVAINIAITKKPNLSTDVTLKGASFSYGD